MKNILVTGGFGFLGSHLVEELVKDKNNQVYVVDDLSTSPLDLKRYLSELGHPSNLAYTISSIEEYCRTADDKKFDQIYHLASIVGPAGVLPHAGKIIKSIIDDAYLMMGLALKYNAKFVDVSTSEVYGDMQNDRCSEDSPKIISAKVAVRKEYGIGKLAAETAIVNTCKVSPLNACIVRPFNIAGPRQSGEGGFVLPRFIIQATSNEPLTVFGDGKQVRAFTHAKDIVSGLIKAMEYGKSSEIYNLGNPANKTTILELAERVINLTNSKSEITFIDPKTIYGALYEDIGNKYPDANKAIKELGWKPIYGIDEVILDAVEEYLKVKRISWKLSLGRL